MEKKLDGNYTRILRAILNTSWRQHSTKQQIYGHLPPITKTIKVRRTRHAGHCWRSRDELISDVLLWTPAHTRTKAGRPARTYIQQFCEDMDIALRTHQKRWTIERSGERGSGISVLVAWWWWWWYKSMGVLDILLLLHIFFFPGLFNKTHIQSVYRVIRKKLKPGWIVIILLFRRRISLHSPSHQITKHVWLEVTKQETRITVYRCIICVR